MCTKWQHNETNSEGKLDGDLNTGKQSTMNCKRNIMEQRDTKPMQNSLYSIF